MSTIESQPEVFLSFLLIYTRNVALIYVKLAIIKFGFSFISFGILVPQTIVCLNVKHLYAVTPYSSESVNTIHANELERLIDDQLFYEMLLMEIRVSQSYASKRTKDNLEKEKVIQERIRQLKDEVQETQDMSDNNEKIEKK